MRFEPGRWLVQTTVSSSPATVRSVTSGSAAEGLMLELDDGARVPLSQVRRIDG